MATIVSRNIDWLFFWCCFKAQWLFKYPKQVLAPTIASCITSEGPAMDWVPHSARARVLVSAPIHLVGISFWLPCVFSYSFILKRHVLTVKLYTILAFLYHILWETIRSDSSEEEINQALRTSHMATVGLSICEPLGKTACIYILFTHMKSLPEKASGFTF